MNSVFTLDTPARLFDIRRIVIEADTAGGAIRQAEVLDKKVSTFLNKQDAWFDDVLIAEMISLAGETGDIVRNPVSLKEMAFEQRNFWTAHFGGVYLFQEMDHPALITGGDKGSLGELPIKYVFDMSERNRIGHQKLSTFLSISVPRDQTPVIQSQYRHQMRSCPTSPSNL